MLTDIVILVYCGAVGFVSAGIVASLYKLLTSEAPRFALFGYSWPAAFASFFFFALTGPFIMAHLMWRRGREKMDSVGVTLGGFGVAALWSVCSGLIVLEFALAIGRDLL